MNSLNADEVFEVGLKHIRDAYLQKSAAREAELNGLRTELVRKDTMLEELQQRVTWMSEELQREKKKNSALQMEVSRMQTFRQHILESFDERDISAYASQRSSARATGVYSATGLADSAGLPTSFPSMAHGTRLSDAPGYGAATNAWPAATPPPSAAALGTAPQMPVTSAPAQAPTSVDGRTFLAEARAKMSPEKYDMFYNELVRYNRKERTLQELDFKLQSLLDDSNRQLLDIFRGMFKV